MRLLVFCSIILTLWSCKKDPIQYTFEGMVADNINQQGLSGVEVTVSYKAFNNSVTSSNYTLGSSDITDAVGNYQLVFDREKATEFKAAFKKDGYFNKDIIMSSGDVSSEDINVVNTTLEARSWVAIHLFNDTPSAPSDELTLIFYTYRTACQNCIEEDYNYFTGELDTTLLFQNTAGSYLKFTYVDVVGGTSTTDSVYMTPFDTVSYNIQY